MVASIPLGKEQPALAHIIVKQLVRNRSPAPVCQFPFCTIVACTFRAGGIFRAVDSNSEFFCALSGVATVPPADVQFPIVYVHTQSVVSQNAAFFTVQGIEVPGCIVDGKDVHIAHHILHPRINNPSAAAHAFRQKFGNTGNTRKFAIKPQLRKHTPCTPESAQTRYRACRQQRRDRTQGV